MTTVAITAKTTGAKCASRLKGAVAMHSMTRGKKGIGDE